jgi:hypothetical protein
MVHEYPQGYSAFIIEDIYIRYNKFLYTFKGIIVIDKYIVQYLYLSIVITIEHIDI